MTTIAIATAGPAADVAAPDAVRHEAPAPGAAPAREMRAIVDRARRGDRAAQAILYQRFAPMIHGVLLARVQPADADDLTQEVFLVAMRRLNQLRDDGAFGAWALQAARNRARAHLRKRARRDAILRTLRPRGHAPPAPPASSATGDECARILDIIRALPEAYRETLALRLVERLSGPEIAARTGMTPGSVRINLHRGMAILRRRLGEAGIEGGASSGAEDAS